MTVGQYKEETINFCLKYEYIRQKQSRTNARMRLYTRRQTTTQSDYPTVITKMRPDKK